MAPIRPGEAWGRPGPLPEDGVVVRSDAEARAVVTEARRAGRPIPTLGLLGGDLCRSLGGTGDEARLRSNEAWQRPVDLGAVLIEGRLHWFVAHLVVRRWWLQGTIVAAMNAQHLGHWNVTPRSHPGDGRIELVEVDAGMAVGQRLAARRRLRTGTHLPHPAIALRPVRATQVELPRPLPVRLDGEVVARARTLSVRVEPDALRCVV